MKVIQKIKNYFNETFKDLTREDAKGAWRHSLSDIKKAPVREILTLVVVVLLPGPWILAYAIHRLHHYRMYKQNPDHQTAAFLNKERLKDAGRMAQDTAQKGFNHVSRPIKKSAQKIHRAKKNLIKRGSKK